MRDYRLTLNLITNDSVASRTFKQFDMGNEIELELFENEHLEEDKRIILTNEKVLAFFQQENGTVIQKNAEIRNGNILVRTTSDVLSVPGVLILECVIIKENVKTTTQTLQFTVNKSIDRNEAVKELPTWDIIDGITKAAETEQSRLREETIRVSNEKNRVANESNRKTNEDNRLTKFNQISQQWQSINTAIKDSNIGQTVVTEVISARTNKEAKTYSNLGERIDTIEDKVTSRDYTSIESNYASVLSLPNSVDGVGHVDYVEGNTLVNLVQDIDWSTAGNSAGFDKTPISNGMRYVKNAVDVSVFPKIIINSTASLLKGNTAYTIVINVNTNSSLQGINVSKGGDAYLGNSDCYKDGRIILNNGIYKTTFTTPSRSEMTMKLSLGFNAFTIADQGKYIELSNLMIFEGDLTSYDFNEYIEGMQSLNRIGVLSNGKNLFSHSKLKIQNLREVKIDRINDDTVVINGGQNGVYMDLYLKKNEVITWSGKTDAINVRIFKNYDFKNIVTGEVQIDSEGNYYCTFKTLEDGVYNFRYWIKDGITKLINTQLVIGNSTPYQPYKQDKIDILTDLRGFGNVRDKIYKDGTIDRKLGEVVLNGSESEWKYANWFNSKNNTLCFQYLFSNIKKEASNNIISSGVKTLSDVNQLYAGLEEGLFTSTDGGVFIRKNKSILGIADTDADTVILQKFKTWLQNNPIKIQYELANPITEKLDRPLNLSSFENGTLFVDSNIPCNVKYSYATNLSSAVSSLNSGLIDIKEELSNVDDEIKTNINTELSKINIDNSRLTNAKDITGAINELFTLSNNAKKDFASVIGGSVNEQSSFKDIFGTLYNAKGKLAQSLTYQGQKSTINDSIEDLADRVIKIKVGKKVARGTIPCSRNILVNNLDFKPNIVYLNSTGREVNRPGESWNRIMSSLDNCIGVTYYLDFTSVASGGGVRCMGDPIYLNGGQRIQILDNGFSVNLGDNSFSFNNDINWIAIE